MTDELQVERAGPADFDELVEMITSCFRANNPQLPRFDVLFPDLYSRAEADMANNFILRDGGRIVSCVGLFPVAVDLCGCTVEIGGIGGVSTRPEYRGRHLMQRLLDRVHEEMVSREYPLGWLAGDRRRYSPWGYEFASQNYRFWLSRRGPGADKYADRLPGPIQEGRADRFDWSILWNQAQNNPALIACGREKLRLKYQRFDMKVYLVTGDRGGHILVRENEKERGIVAFAGCPETVGTILVENLKTTWPNACAYLPLFASPFSGVFDDLMGWYEMAVYGSYAILDLAKTLSYFRPHFNRRVADLGLKGTVKIVMGPTRQIPPQEVILEADGREFHLTTVTGRSVIDPTVELTCRQMVELLFSPRTGEWFARLPATARWLAALMPAPVFLPYIYSV